MNPTYDFTGQVALVAGASSGMGLATAQAFAEAGAAVVLADIKAPRPRTPDWTATYQLLRPYPNHRQRVVYRRNAPPAD